MAENRVFFPQQALDAWLEEGRVLLVGDELTVSPEGRRLQLQSALRFTAEVASGEDPHGLVGKVKTQEQLAALSGELCADSVIIGDSAYQVVEGFLGELLPGVRRPSKRKTSAKLEAGPDALAITLREE